VGSERQLRRRLNHAMSICKTVRLHQFVDGGSKQKLTVHPSAAVMP
jgi:hypothetical protein